MKIMLVERCFIFTLTFHNPLIFKLLNVILILLQKYDLPKDVTLLINEKLKMTRRKTKKSIEPMMTQKYWV